MTETEIMLRDSLAEYQIPEHMHDGAVMYVLHGVPPGNFLTAVLENDLHEAVARADAENQRQLVQWVKWFYNEAPGACWGSPEHLQAWCERHAKDREAAKCGEVGRGLG